MSKVARAWESGAPTKVQVRPQQEVMKDGIAMIRKDMALRLFGGFDAEGTSLMLDGDAAAETRNDATHPSIARHARPVDFKAAEDEGHRFVVHAQRCCQQLRVPNTLVSVYDKNGVALGHLAEQDMGDYVCCDDDRDIAVMKVLDGNGKQVFALRRKSTCRDMFHVCGYLRLCGMPVCKPCESRPPMVLRCPCTIFPVMLSSACASCCVVAGISTDCCQPKPESRDSKCQSPCPKCEDQCGTWYGELCCCASCLPFALCVLPCIHCLEMEKICKCQLPEGTFCRSYLVEWPRDPFQCNCINPSSPCPASCCQVTKGTMATRPGLETFPIFYMCVIPNVKPVTRSFNLRESSKKSDQVSGIWKTPVHEDSRDRAVVTGSYQWHYPLAQLLGAQGVESVHAEFVQPVSESERIAFSTVIFWESMNRYPRPNQTAYTRTASKTWTLSGSANKA